MVRKILKRIDTYFEEFLLSSLLVVLTVAMLLQVMLRYLFNAALPWPEEFCRYCFVYFAFLTLGYCVKTDTLLRLDLLKRFLPATVWTILNLFIQICCLVFYLYFFTYSTDLVMMVKNPSRTSPAMGIPFFYIYVSAVIGFGLAAIRAGQSLWGVFWRRIQQPS